MYNFLTLLLSLLLPSRHAPPRRPREAGDCEEGTRAPCYFCLSIVDLFHYAPRDECQFYVRAGCFLLFLLLVCGISPLEFRCVTRHVNDISLTRARGPPSCFSFSHLSLPSSVLPLGFVFSLVRSAPAESACAFTTQLFNLVECTRE
jgi:hypothetical protein